MLSSIFRFRSRSGLVSILFGTYFGVFVALLVLRFVGCFLLAGCGRCKLFTSLFIFIDNIYLHINFVKKKNLTLFSNFFFQNKASSQQIDEVQSNPVYLVEL